MVKTKKLLGIGKRYLLMIIQNWEFILLLLLLHHFGGDFCNALRRPTQIKITGNL